MSLYYYIAITCLLALTGSSRADGPLGVYAPGHSSADYYAYPSYAFDYAVKDPHTGDNKAQWEKRDGDVVKGAYSLVEPDGSLRIVEYWADDKHGFNAVVKRIGSNVHPTPIVSAPIYKAAIPTIGEHGPIAPWSIGPVAKFDGLAGAPLLSGPYHGGAISSASLVKDNGHGPIAPWSLGPVAKLDGLGGAPLLSGPYHGGAVSSASIVKDNGHEPIAPWSLGPVGKLDGLAGAPLISSSYHGGAMSSANLIKGAPIPIVKAISEPFLPAPLPIVKSIPIIPEAPVREWSEIAKGYSGYGYSGAPLPYLGYSGLGSKGYWDNLGGSYYSSPLGLEKSYH